MEESESIYIVLSRPKRFETFFISLLSRNRLCHASLSLSKSLDEMYSFGYKYANFPFIAGFVKEKIGEGIFQAKKNLSIAVLQIKVARKTYDAIKEFLKEMYEKKEQYKYNYVGLIFATFHCFFKHKNWFYCSEFVRDLLVKFNVIKLDLKKIVKPMDFLDLENVKVIFDGLQNDYGRICCAA